MTFDEWYPTSAYGQSVMAHEYREPSRIAFEATHVEPAKGLTANEIEREVQRRYKYDSARNSFRAGAVYARDFYEEAQYKA